MGSLQFNMELRTISNELTGLQYLTPDPVQWAQGTTVLNSGPVQWAQGTLILNSGPDPMGLLQFNMELRTISNELIGL